MMDTPFLNLKSCKIINLSNKIRCFISKCNKLNMCSGFMFITNKKKFVYNK